MSTNRTSTRDELLYLRPQHTLKVLPTNLPVSILHPEKQEKEERGRTMDLIYSFDLEIDGMTRCSTETFDFSVCSYHLVFPIHLFRDSWDHGGRSGIYKW